MGCACFRESEKREDEWKYIGRGGGESAGRDGWEDAESEEKGIP